MEYINKLGFLVNNLGCSQLGFFLIKNLNEYLAQHIGLDPIVFYERLFPTTLEPHFSVMQICEAYGFKGTLIATDLSTAKKLINFPCASKKLFYVWDLEWIRKEQKHWMEFQPIYNSSLDLLARSNSHKKIIENCWNKPVYDVVNDFDMEKIMRVAFNG